MAFDFKNKSALELAKYLIAILHIIICVHSWWTLGSFVSLSNLESNLETLAPLIISIYTALFLYTLLDKRWTYYVYIALALLNIMVVLFGRNAATESIQKAFFPFYLIATAILILDLKRVIILAYRNRSAQ